MKLSGHMLCGLRRIQNEVTRIIHSFVYWELDLKTKNAEPVDQFELHLSDELLNNPVDSFHLLSFCGFVKNN